MLHDVARLGEPAAVVDRLVELAAECEGEFVGTYAAHARLRPAARATRSPTSPSASPSSVPCCSPPRPPPKRPRRTSAPVTAAPRPPSGSGQRRSARRAKERTPGLAVPVTVVPLTGRERDIATLAARGEPSKAIAERLFLSVRTVNNHLQNVYSKLGVGSRRELAAALADLDTGDE